MQLPPDQTALFRADYVITGLAGSLVGGFLLERFGIDLGIRNQTASRIATAMIGAIVVVLIVRLVS